MLIVLLALLQCCLVSSHLFEIPSNPLCENNTPQLSSGQVSWSASHPFCLANGVVGFSQTGNPVNKSPLTYPLAPNVTSVFVNVERNRWTTQSFAIPNTTAYCETHSVFPPSYRGVPPTITHINNVAISPGLPLFSTYPYFTSFHVENITSLAFTISDIQITQWVPTSLVCYFADPSGSPTTAPSASPTTAPSGNASAFVQYETQGYCNLNLYPQPDTSDNCYKACLEDPDCQGYTIVDFACLIVRADCCSGIIANISGADTYYRRDKCLG